MAVRETFLRFDSLGFSRSAHKKMRSLIGRLSKYFNVYVSVADYRFVPYGAAIRYYSDERAVTVPVSDFITRRRPKKFVSKLFGTTFDGLKVRCLVEFGK